MCIELPFSGFFGRVILHLNSKICKQHHKKAKEIISDAFDYDIILPAREGYIVDQQRLYFKEGANWMLEKAIDWLQYHVNDYLFDDGTPDRPWLKCKSEMFDAFRKAMEE